jgi:hypothetical protein
MMDTLYLLPFSLFLQVYENLSGRIHLYKTENIRRSRDKEEVRNYHEYMERKETKRDKFAPLRLSEHCLSQSRKGAAGPTTLAH